MSGYEVGELTEIEDKLDALVSPSSEDVWQTTRPYDARAIASVAATRAGSGGGGAQPSVDDGIVTIAAVSAIQLPPGTLSEPSPGVAAIDHLLQYATVRLEAADILGLHSTPVEIVPTPGPGKALIALSGHTIFHHGATPYDADLTGDFSITTALMATYGNDVYTWLTSGHLGISHGWDSIGLLVTKSIENVTGLPNFDLGDVVDQPLVALTWTDVPSGGDGTLDVSVYYLVVDVT